MLPLAGLHRVPIAVLSGRSEVGKEPVAGRNEPLLTDTVEVLVETVGHNNVHANHVVGGLEAAGGNVSL